MRTWQTAHVMKKRRGSLPGDGPADNVRAKRYVAKYTICPAVASGIDHEVGSVAVGKLADLVLWDPAFFGVRPHVVIKGGAIAWGAMGDANASIPTPQPILSRPMFGAYGNAAPATSLLFVAQAALDDGLADRLGIRKKLAAVADTRTRGKADLPGNDALPRIEVDPDTFTVRIDGEVVEPDPVTELPMASDISFSEPMRAFTQLLILADGRFPSVGTRTPAGWRRRSPAGGCATWTTCGIPARAAAHRWPGRRRVHGVRLRATVHDGRAGGRARRPHPVAGLRLAARKQGRSLCGGARGVAGTHVTRAARRKGGFSQPVALGSWPKPPGSVRRKAR